MSSFFVFFKSLPSKSATTYDQTRRRKTLLKVETDVNEKVEMRYNCTSTGNSAVLTLSPRYRGRYFRVEKKDVWTLDLLLLGGQEVFSLHVVNLLQKH